MVTSYIFFSFLFFFLIRNWYQIFLKIVFLNCVNHKIFENKSFLSFNQWGNPSAEQWIDLPEILLDLSVLLSILIWLGMVKDWTRKFYSTMNIKHSNYCIVILPVASIVSDPTLDFKGCFEVLYACIF